MRRKIISILLLVFVVTNCFSQKSDAEKALWKFNYSKTLKRALKNPSKAKEVYILNYTDSVFPNDDILRLINIEHIVVFAKYVLKKKKNDSLNSPVTITIDTIKLKQLSKLKYLTFSNFDFRSFPIQLCYLKNLQALNLSFCLIDSVPREIENLKSLKALALRLNNLKQVPKSIIHLDSLSVVDLANNSFSYFPNELIEMKSLKKVLLSNPESPYEIQSLHWSWPISNSH
jgi:Leucine-rich repeat (LRR) protein